LRERALLAVLVAVAIVCAAPGVARASTAPDVPWCGTDVSATDRPDIVAGKQVHVIYAFPSDGPDRFPQLAGGISTDLSAVVNWWQHQDYTRAPRFDLASFPCGAMGALDISDVRLAEPAAAFQIDAQSRYTKLATDLSAAGFDNSGKKYLVYYDSPVPLSTDICGVGHEDPTNGGAVGYAAVFIAANIESGEFDAGCGDIEVPSDRGGYSASIAAHELIHTFGGLDTWDSPGPPHACPGTTSHACDDPLDIMQPSGTTYWIDNTFLDAGHDDYYGHSGTWWDVQDSTWLRHLNEPVLSLDVTPGAGIQSVTSDLPGVSCTAGAACHSTWDTGPGAAIVLNATPVAGFTRIVWGGACSGISPSCSILLDTNTSVTVSALKQLTVAAAGVGASPGRVQAHITLSRLPGKGEASVTCASAKLTPVSHSIKGTVATCVWAVPKALRGKGAAVRISVELDDGRELTRAFGVKTLKR
jgi:hypothetical protein